MNFDPNVWGPHYWFFLHTIAESYPMTPNQVTKRKYYDLITNFPLFIPNEEIGNNFSKMIDKYPVTPYLDCRESFVRWVHFIHNKVNIFIGKEEVSMAVALDQYRAHYKPMEIYLAEKIKMRKHIIYAGLIGLVLYGVYTCYE